MQKRLTAITAAAIIAATAANARMATSVTADDLTVFISGGEVVPNYILTGAGKLAGEKLAEAGVRIIWRSGNPKDQTPLTRQMAVRFRMEPDRGIPVAFSLPYEGSAITIFYSRIKWAETDLGLAPALLAHTLAHEITHNLQAIDRHSKTGVMKKNWTPADYRQMRLRRLPFEPVDIELIRLGVKVWEHLHGEKAEAHPARHKL